MKYLTVAETDVGIVKETNQDSVLVKHADSKLGEIVLAIICDGMGGLSKGELASATVVRRFSEWFEEELPGELQKLDFEVISGKWSLMLKDLNTSIGKYGETHGVRLGTTFTALLIVKDNYLIGHVGDTRVYEIDSSLNQLTEDQTFIARELKKGTITPEQARVDKRRNMLLQCIGASPNVEPEMKTGKCRTGAFLLCSDGFRHEISEKEIFDMINPKKLSDKEDMHKKLRALIEMDKKRKEKDNISAVLIKAFEY